MKAVLNRIYVPFWEEGIPDYLRGMFTDIDPVGIKLLSVTYLDCLITISTDPTEAVG